MLVWCKYNTGTKNCLLNIIDTVTIDNVLKLEGKNIKAKVLISPNKSDIGKTVFIIGYGKYNRPKRLK